MKILVVGGGSGGHITPAVAVIREVIKLKPRTKIEFWTDRKYYKNVVKITTELGVRWGEENKSGSEKNPYVIVRKIMAGKFHRYANRKLIEYFQTFGHTMKDIVLGNILGFVGFVGVFIKSCVRLLPRENRPDVIFLKGGFVGLPVGLVARILKIPYVIHESDTAPGLANRILMKRAKVVAMGAQFELPNFDDISEQAELERRKKQNWQWVGTPVGSEFQVVSRTQQKALKKVHGFEPDEPLVVVTGGSQGAQHINEVIREILPEMLKFCSVGLVAGRKYYDDMLDLKKYESWDKAKLKSNFRMWNFNAAMHELMGAADLIVSRAGATTISELASLKKSVILVPFEKLPGGHQLSNAKFLKKKQAVEMISDSEMLENPEKLLAMIKKLVKNSDKRSLYAENLHKTIKSDAALDLAKILIGVCNEVR